MISIDNLKSLDELQYTEVYEQVRNYEEGEKASIAYFKGMHLEDEYNGQWSDDMVKFYGPKKFRGFDKENNIEIETIVYESYIDSGSVDYFFFSYVTKL